MKKEIAGTAAWNGHAVPLCQGDVASVSRADIEASECKGEPVLSPARVGNVNLKRETGRGWQERAAQKGTNVTAMIHEIPTAEDKETAQRREFIAGLRALADFLEAHPEVPRPGSTTLNAFVRTREELAQIARVGRWDKGANDHYFWLGRTFAGSDDLFPLVRLEVNADREVVCRKVVKGTKTIPAQPELTVEDVEWVCDESLLAGAQS